MFLSLNGKPVQIMKYCFCCCKRCNVERKENKIQNEKSFYKKYFAPKKGKLNHHCFWFKLSEFLFIFERGTANDQIFSHHW